MEKSNGNSYLNDGVDGDVYALTREIEGMEGEIDRINDGTNSKNSPTSKSVAGKRDELIFELDRLIHLQQRYIVAELSQQGVVVERFEDVCDSRKGYGDLLPLVICHLKMRYCRRNKELFAYFCLINPSRKYFEFFIEEFSHCSNCSKDRRYCNIVANIIRKLAKKQDVDKIIKLIDSSASEERMVLLLILKKFRKTDPAAGTAVKRYLQEPSFVKEIRSWD